MQAVNHFARLSVASLIALAFHLQSLGETIERISIPRRARSLLAAFGHDLGQHSAAANKSSGVAFISPSAMSLKSFRQRSPIQVHQLESNCPRHLPHCPNW